MTAVLAGALAGICGLENLWGFGVYLLLTVMGPLGFGVYLLLTVMGPLVFVAETRKPLNNYFQQSSEPFTSSLFSGLLRDTESEPNAYS
ncbi:hypothetical protein EAH_00034190 [Eimeria acervulina]|uniref:Uncharacterized protein n=1 Tax=Eimeria acervulina TaxID=5801 RepID=U6GV79_EIMAC|nr:hypothetical protein EAH_00034190 [Eimeria acervulina]CDI83193.1 hypothetical protein EAH_00034190 [Eimeria acervulina]